MIWKKYSSVVRWLFYISIIEFLLPHLLYLIPSFRNEMDYNFAKSLGINNWIIALTIVQYAVAIDLIVLFYKRYKEISVLDDAGKLMKRIFRTRQTVKHYVLFCLAMVLLIFAVFIVGMALDDNLAETLNLKNQSVDPEQLKWLLIGVMTVAGILFTVLLAGIYGLLYGLLTRKLSRNYIELKRMEA